ncbi:MAG: methyltransferase [Candidatus Saccharibacteria bacterium]|nr:methyltransferase [Candidatus Saccharibacteria bacterium]
MLIVFAIVGVFLGFAFVVFFGAPYLPTLSPQIDRALNLADLKEGETLLELGCGDGRVVAAAAKRGYKVVGYELNPVLALFSWVRTRKYRGQVKIVWGNFWRKKMPEADAIFVFLLQRYMKKLDNKITQEYSGKSIKLVSFAFKVPGRVIKK